MVWCKTVVINKRPVKTFTGRLFESRSGLPALQHDFAYAVAAFNVAVGLLQIGHIDGANDFVQRGFDFAHVD